MPLEFVWNNHVIADMNEIANEINRYFISIGHSLSEKNQSVYSSEDISDRKLTLFSDSQQVMRIV